MSFIGFEFGSTNSSIYNGQYFADNEDVIVVSAKSVGNSMVLTFYS